MDVLRLMKPLLIVTMFSLALAVLALVTDRQVNTLAPPQILLADYAARLDESRTLDITHGLGISGVRDIKLRFQNGQWVLPQRDDYPANQELVTETLLALANVKTLEARTAKAKWHRALGLVVPEDLGRAVRFSVRNAQGEVLAQLLLGNEQESEAEAKQDVKTYGPELRQFYVRRADSDQSWLARGRIPRNPNVAAWIDARVARHTPHLPESVRFGKGARQFTMVRAGDDSWSMGGGAEWAADFTRLRPDDVTRADDINFATAQPMVLHFSDGLVLVYESVGAATVIWARISARTKKTANAETRALAAEINARYDGWALRFSTERAGVLLPARTALEQN